MKLAIIGFGYTAQDFVARYHGRFDTVVATVRSPDKAARLSHTGLDVLAFDGLTASPELVARLVTADAALISVPPGEVCPALRVLGDALARSATLHWIGYLSTVGVYGNHDGAWVDEDTVCKPVSRRSIERVAAEQQWLSFGRAHRKAVHVFRLAGIYGPGRNVLMKLRDGTARRLVKEGQVFNRIHVADIAGVLAASLTRPDAGRIYNVTDNEPAPPQDVVAYGAELLGIPPPVATSFDPAALTAMAASFYAENKRVSNRRIRTELGYDLLYPSYREALISLAADQMAYRSPSAP